MSPATLKQAIQTALDLWGKLPTTQARVSFTLVCVLGTAIRYWIGGWAPSLEWLMFLAAMSGLDGVQFAAKRMTDATYVAALKGQAPAAPPLVAPEATP